MGVHVLLAFLVPIWTVSHPVSSCDVPPPGTEDPLLSVGHLLIGVGGVHAWLWSPPPSHAGALFHRDASYRCSFGAQRKRPARLSVFLGKLVYLFHQAAIAFGFMLFLFKCLAVSEFSFFSQFRTPNLLINFMIR